MLECIVAQLLQDCITEQGLGSLLTGDAAFLLLILW